VPQPGPAIGASLVLLFLFQHGNSAWGGNLASTLAGEFAFSISLPLALAYLAWHERGASRRGAAVVSVLLIALVAVTHAYTVIWIGLASGILAVLGPRPVIRAARTAALYLAAAALCAFWLLPLLWYSPWTTAFRHVWIINSIGEVFPPPLWPVAAAAAGAPIALARWHPAELGAHWRESSILYAAAAAAGLAYAGAPNFGIVDTRFLPFLQLSLCLLAAAGVGHVLHRTRFAAWSVPIAFVACAGLVHADATRLASWATWNYEGFERKPLWPVYQQIIEAVRGGPDEPRVAYEHSPDHEALGTIRAFENLPLFSGRSTLEGVNFQASVTAPFVFYVQSEISRVMSCPFGEWGCSRPDLEAGIEHLRMMHASELILRSDTMKAAASRVTDLELTGAYGPYALYRITGPRAGYGIALADPPYAVVTDDWKSEAYRWFKRARSADPIPVFVRNRQEADAVFGAVRDGLPPVVPRAAPSGAPPPPLIETFESERLVLEGLSPGRAVVIRLSYHPRWQSTSGERVWLAGPGFMLVIPQGNRLELVYGTGLPVVAGRLISGAAALTLLVLASGVRFRPWWSRGETRRAAWVPRQGGERAIRVVFCVSCAAAIIGLGIHARYQDADIVYRHGQRQLDGGDRGAPPPRFRQARALAPLSNTAIHATYFEAITLYRQERWAEAGRVFQTLVETFPEAHAAAEAVYHMGLCAERLGRRPAALEHFRTVRQLFPETIWAGFSGDRLRELGAQP
jgi:hypothetical protein